MRKLKIILALLSLVVAIVILTTNGHDEKVSSKPLIVTSNFAIFDLVTNISKEKFEVENILPFGVDPHSFEPTPKEVAKLEKSAFFFYSGEVLEPWTQSLAQEVNAVNLSHHVDLIELDKDNDGDEHEEGHHHHHHGSYDPHYWLDIDNMKKMAQLVTQKLSQVDRENKTFYEKNSLEYIAKLKELDTLYKQRLLSCKQDTIVVTHNAFSYLAQRYQFQVESLTGLSSESQASAQDVKHILKTVKEKGIQTIFFENFSSSRDMQTIADDLGVKLEVLQPLGNITADECKQSLDYIKIMEINLEKISEAMQCN
ncbi:MAG: metal ABC transporter substrate-binding protein [Sulfurimonas sp.]